MTMIPPDQPPATRAAPPAGGRPAYDRVVLEMPMRLTIAMAVLNALSDQFPDARVSVSAQGHWVVDIEPEVDVDDEGGPDG